MGVRRCVRQEKAPRNILNIPGRKYGFLESYVHKTQDSG